ncbi:MAG: hypothetical protein HFH60_11920 [Lachnospiraceae bacterium]|nr:hypothetical protein [Lachnospiraceae bacterium]
MVGFRKKFFLKIIMGTFFIIFLALGMGIMTSTVEAAAKKPSIQVKTTKLSVGESSSISIQGDLLIKIKGSDPIKKVTVKSSSPKIKVTQGKKLNRRNLPRGTIKFKKQGTYKLYITALDDKSRKTTKKITVTVGKKLSSYVKGIKNYETEKGKNISIKNKISYNKKYVKSVQIIGKPNYKKIGSYGVKFKLKGISGDIQWVYRKVKVVKYTYEISVLNNPKYNLYNKTHIWFYIKTKDPDQLDNLYLDCPDNGGHNVRLAAEPVDVHIIKRDDNIVPELMRVKGGYIGNLQFNKPGMNRIRLRKMGESAALCEKKVQVKDYDAAQNNWFNKVISEETGKSMTQKEKMYSLIRYVERNFKYDFNDGGKVVALVGESGAFFENYRGTCITFAQIMRKFADKLGLESRVQYAGYAEHYYAVVKIDGKEEIYDAMIFSSSGRIKNIKYIL